MAGFAHLWAKEPGLDATGVAATVTRLGRVVAVFTLFVAGQLTIAAAGGQASAACQRAFPTCLDVAGVGAAVAALGVRVVALLAHAELTVSADRELDAVLTRDWASKSSFGLARLRATIAAFVVAIVALFGAHHDRIAALSKQGRVASQVPGLSAHRARVAKTDAAETDRRAPGRIPIFSASCGFARLVVELRNTRTSPRDTKDERSESEWMRTKMP